MDAGVCPAHLTAAASNARRRSRKQPCGAPRTDDSPDIGLGGYRRIRSRGHVPDGRAGRAAYPRGRGRQDGQESQASGRALHLVGAVTHDSARLVAQRPVDEKSNEITALRPMLQDIPLDGVVVTADAMQAQQDKESDETVLGITSLSPVSDIHDNAEVLLDVARGHWTIENGNHYVRDRTYDEDRCPVRNPNSAHILASLRSMARFLAKTAPPGTATQERRGDEGRRSGAKWNTVIP